MKKLRYICAQPANNYYTWQVEVMINNFMSMGVNPNDIDILLGYNHKIDDVWLKLQQSYPYVRFFFYEDNRKDKTYIPSIYFYLMKCHLKEHLYLENETLFIHDSDIVFTHPPQFESMVYGKAWYLSNTNSYINYDYIQQKGNHIYEKMCEIVGIDKLIPKLLNNNSGGAQYIVKNTNYEFWDKVELDSVNLYKYFCDTESSYVKKYEGDFPIQKWTAGMWSLLWNAWYFGHETIVDKKLDFGWVTNPYSDVEKYSILHNAGVVNNSNGLFYKGDYINKLPYGVDLEIDKSKASLFYWEEIKKTAKKSCLV
jgi:hypothetical protein